MRIKIRYYISILYAVIAGVVCTPEVLAQGEITLEGRITDFYTGSAVVGASVLITELHLWAIADAEGRYVIPRINAEKVHVQIASLGYVAQHMELTLRAGRNTYDVRLKENSLAIGEVVVTSQKRTESQSSSYVVDRNTLNHAQLINLNHITTLLPGGKTIGDQNLASAANRIALHAGNTSELGNASFGTAIDIDGMRWENNATLAEIQGADLRNLGTSNIESVEVVTGIPSVEYGDLSNGIVKINTRKGKSPFIVEFMVEPKTTQIALSKGFTLGSRAGTLNVNAERTRSVSNIASPYTAYDRNNLNLTYSNIFEDHRDRPLRFTASVAGNIGGYNSKADPDEFQNTYTKTRDYLIRGNMKLDWLLNKRWITNLSLQATASYSDKLSETNTNKSSASSQPYIHATEQGYYVGQLYDDNPDAEIILSPTGYWYSLAFTDSKPLTYSVKAKADWTKRRSGYLNRVLLGVELHGSGNLGRGLYYDDMRYAPTWREYRYDKLPFMNNLALFVEDKFSAPVGEHSLFHLTVGLRSDMTFINNSDYGTVTTFSPRINAKYTFWKDKSRIVSDLSIYGGWGKSSKQPSFAVLYPTPSYSDKLAFTPGTMADGTTFYAYYTQPTTSAYNPNLKWQHTQQSEIGIETKIYGTRISVSAFYNKTFNPYISRMLYTPYTYKFTSQADIERDCTIPAINRLYAIDKQTGVVTVKDRTGVQPDQILGYKEMNTYVGRGQYVNGSPVKRCGIDWIVDFARINPLRTQVRVDGNYYWYKGLNETLVASSGSAQSSIDGSPYKYIGYFVGSASAGNGSLSKQLNTNLTIVTHIPKIRMIFSVRIEASFLNYTQNLCEYADGTPRGYLLEKASDFEGVQDRGLYNKGKYVVVYPKYYTTWDNPNEMIPFAEKFRWAKENDAALYNDLCKLIVKTNTSYYFDENRLTSYFAANFNLTKEIGRFASITFYARNFFYNMGKVRSSQTGLESSLFDSGYIPKFYYGLSLRLKF